MFCLFTTVTNYLPLYYSTGYGSDAHEEHLSTTNLDPDGFREETSGQGQIDPLWLATD
jgi:hypothetical protein